MKTNIAKSFDEFFAKHAETLETYNAKAEALTAEKPDSVTAYIDEALSIDDEDGFYDEDAYDFEPVPVPDDDASTLRFTP